MIICIFLLSHCVYTKIGYLSEDELEWLEPTKSYNRGLFRSNLENESSLFLYKGWKDNSLDPFHVPWVSCSPYSIKRASAGYNFCLTQPDTSYKGLFKLICDPTDDSIYTKICVGYMLITDKPKYLKTDTFILNDQQILHDCLIFDTTMTFDNGYFQYYHPNERRIIELVISKEFDPIYYKFKDSVKYKREFKQCESDN